MSVGRVRPSAVTDPVDLANPAPPPPAGWYPDSEQPGTQRYWTGSDWTDEPSPQRSPSSVPVELWLSLAAATGIIIGSIAPWATVVFATANGLDGDGKITLCLGVIAAVSVAFAINGRDPRSTFLPSLICGLLSAGLAIYHLINISGAEANIFGETIQVARPGWGLWLTAIAAVGLVLAAFSVRRATRAPSI